jgi:hypothetical protein
VNPVRAGRLDAAIVACRRRPALAAAATAAYVLWVTVTHDHVQDVAYWLQRTFGREVWSPVVAGFGACGVAWAAWLAARRLAASPVRAEASAAWWGTLALLVAAFLSLLATNMEMLHFVQYAIPAVPVFALTRRFATTVLVVTAFGAADEWWQYAVLHRGWAVPWDVNDVVLNALGASLGGATILVFANCVVAAGPRRAAAPVAAVLAAGGAAVALRAAGVLALHPEDGPAAILLARSGRPAERWNVPEWGRGHYQLHPGAAFAICAVAVAAFAWVDRRVEWREPGARD